MVELNLPDPKEISRIGIIGTGVIGSGWVAHFLRCGMDVTAFDPAPDAAEKLRGTVAHVWPTLERLGLSEGASPDRLSLASTLVEAVQGAQFIQESSPEREDLKRRIIEDIDRAADSSVPVASSTSGVPMSILQTNCRHPERCIVGHPFNPPYLIPLVEVVPGDKTSPDVSNWVAEFYALTGKKPLKLSKEYPAFLANRLLEAVWREALHLVDDGLATVEEIDVAMSYAPALRWAIMGPFMIYHLAGGEGGIAHFLDQFGPSLKYPWSYMNGPELTPALRQQVIDGCERMAAGRSMQEIIRERDECLIEVMRVLEKCRS